LGKAPGLARVRGSGAPLRRARLVLSCRPLLPSGSLPSRRSDMPRGRVELPDLAGGTHQVGVVQLCSDSVFVGLGEEPAETQGLFEERQGDIERRPPFFNPKRNLPATLTRADVVVASDVEGIEAERLFPIARDGDQDPRPVLA